MIENGFLKQAEDGFVMDRSALRKLLDCEMISSRAYGVDGVSGLPVEDREERYFLEKVASGWAVYYWERGPRSGGRVFAEEDEACRYLLDLLLRDAKTGI